MKKFKNWLQNLWGLKKPVYLQWLLGVIILMPFLLFIIGMMLLGGNLYGVAPFWWFGITAISMMGLFIGFIIWINK